MALGLSTPSFAQNAPSSAQKAQGSAQPGVRAPMPLNASDQALIKQRLVGLKRLTPMLLDLSKPEDLAMHHALHRMAGRTPDNDPDLAQFNAYATDWHKRKGTPRDPYVFLRTDGVKVNAAGVVTDYPIGPITSITSFQSTSASTRSYATSGLVSLPGQPQTCTQTLQILDEQGNPNGQADSVTQVLACENVQLYATGTLDPSDKWAKAALTTRWIDQSGTPYVSVMAAEGSAVPTKIVSTDPNDKNGDQMIKFCFGRSSADCDYAPSGSSAQNVILPINGNASYSGALVDPKTDSNASVYIAITQPTPQAGGGCNLVADTKAFMQQYVTLSNSNMTVNWANPGVLFPAINSACMPNGSVVYFNMMMNLDLAGTISLPTFFGISSAPNTPVSTGYYLQLAQTRVYYSCLVAGTMVDMADGSRRAIEDIVVGDKVLDGNGIARRVESTFVGDEKEVVRIAAGPVALGVSAGHPVMTTDGVRLAKFVQAGDKVRIRTGGQDAVVTVTTAALEPYGGKVYNLRLEKDLTQAGMTKIGFAGAGLNGAGLTQDGDATFFGNGVLVGDNEAQWRYAHAGATRDAKPAPAIRPAMSPAGKAALEERLGRFVDATIN
jgi:hypothetical protein